MIVGPSIDSSGACHFRVWSPHRKSIGVHLLGGDSCALPMERDDSGYWHLEIANVRPGLRYLLRIDDSIERPDPASNCQPEGVHGPSQIIDHESFKWTDDDWRCMPLRSMIMYELHVGTFTPQGTFDGVIEKLEHLKRLGINAIELMPVAQFPGVRNWGYDGVYPYAVQMSYGGVDGLKRLVNAAHGEGLAVILDVVYNHLGPEGNYLHEFAPYFSSRYHTPWGWAINYDGAYSNDVRNYFIENALYWLREFHIDALRLDAIHGVFDFSARPFLLELSERVDDFARSKDRAAYLIAESDLNDVRVIRPREIDGLGIPAQWSDDFHHSLHVLLTGETGGYYADFGRITDLVLAMREGFVLDGKYSRYRLRNHGSSSATCDADQFVVYSQDHDQTGNRALGERLSTLVSFEGLKVAAASVLLGPNIPLLWMGEEYAEIAPFLYFIHHADEATVEAVRRGRKAATAAFGWEEDPPDPQAPETFERSKLDWSQCDRQPHRVMLELYRELIELRKTIPALSQPTKDGLAVQGLEDIRCVVCSRRWAGSEVWYLMSFSDNPVTVSLQLSRGTYRRLLDTGAKRWLGPGTQAPNDLHAGDEMSTVAITCAPLSVVLYERVSDEGKATGVA